MRPQLMAAINSWPENLALISGPLSCRSGSPVTTPAVNRIPNRTAAPGSGTCLRRPIPASSSSSWLQRLDVERVEARDAVGLGPECDLAGGPERLIRGPGDGLGLRIPGLLGSG